MITAAAMSSNWIWYFGRATGFVALILMTAIIVLGIVSRLRFASERWPRFMVSTLHRDLALMALLVLGIHIAAAVLDTYVKIPIAAVIVPFVSTYQPFWVGLGALAIDLMLATIITSLLRRQIGLRVWKAIHWSNYAIWPVAVAHGLGNGSDSGTAWGQGLTAACCLVVVGAVVARLVATPVPSTPLVTPTRGPGGTRVAHRLEAHPARVRPAEAARVRPAEQLR